MINKYFNEHIGAMAIKLNAPFAFKEAIMTAINPNIRLMTWEETFNEKLHNRGLILEHQGKSFNLNAGTRETIHVFTRSIYLFVLP